MHDARVIRRVEVATTAIDPDRYGVGSSSAPGDAYRNALFIPQWRAASGARFSFLLCGVSVGPGEVAVVEDWGITTTIAQQVDVTTEVGGVDAWSYVVEREVVSPLWSFPDGNTASAIMVSPIGTDIRAKRLLPGATQGLPETSPALLFEQYNPSTHLYVPPAQGIFTGRVLDGMGMRRDQMEHGHLGNRVVGPCWLQVVASVLQTDPETRPYLPRANYPVTGGMDGLRPEDQFLLSWGAPDDGNAVRYRHIAGRLRVAFLEANELTKGPCP